MAIKIISTKNYNSHGIKVLVYGPAGIGKTCLAATAPRPIIISAESGLLSLQGVDIPAIEVNNLDDVIEVFNWAKSSVEAKAYDTLCLDSITEIAEVMLSTYKSTYADARQAYGDLADHMGSMIRGFRDIKGKNVYFSAKQVRVEIVSGVTSFMPGMPGKNLLNGLPFFFDEVFSMRVGKLEDKTTYRYLQTYTDIQYEGKDRSGRLDSVEEPDLTKLFAKIAGPKEVEEEKEEEKMTAKVDVKETVEEQTTEETVEETTEEITEEITEETAE